MVVLIEYLKYKLFIFLCEYYLVLKMNLILNEYVKDFLNINYMKLINIFKF